jgi:Uma2 family endonuclease
MPPPVTRAQGPPQRGEPTWEIARLFPRQGEWTESDYLALETNHLVELAEGVLEVLPVPTLLHQLIVSFLYEVLKAFVREHAEGLVLFAPLPVRLGRGKFREPDVVYLRPERVQDRPSYPEGADLVMEVLSEGRESRERDLESKGRDYAEAGIDEYWVVDPETRRITVLVLDGSSYREHATFEAGQIATSVLLQGFQVPVDAVFAAGEQP